MVHAVLLVTAVLFVTGGILSGIFGAIAAAVGLAVWGLVLIIGLLVERWRYKPLTERSPGPDWTATDECFVDPETGKLVRVYYHPSSGERRYVAS